MKHRVRRVRRPCQRHARRRHLAVLIGWMACGIAFAVETPPTNAPPAAGAMLDRAAALAAASDVTAERYPDANEVLVDAMQRMVYAPDGTFEQWHEEYVKILTEEGRRRYRTLSSYFTIPYQRGPEDCLVTLLEIIKPDGRCVPIDVEGQSRVMVNPSSMSENIYNPNSKILRVNVPGLEVGDTLHFVMFDRIVQARMADAWNDWIVFEQPRPIRRSVVEIHAPAAKPLRSIALKDPVKGTVTETRDRDGNRLQYRWEARDVPRAFPEPNMPPMHTVVQRLLVSTLADWQTVSRWYWDLSTPHYDATDAMRAKVEELVAGQDEPLDRIQALFRFVAQEVRYMGITVEATSPGYEPHDVKDTFEARHGVCRDKAALLVVMLRLGGIEAFPALIHAGPKKDPEVPQPYFNHAIVAARYDLAAPHAAAAARALNATPLSSSTGHAYILMDPTAETSARLLPAYLNDCSVLIASPEGEPLLTSPIDPASANLMEVTTRGRIDATGRLTAQTDLAFGGVNDNAYRGFFARSKPEERRRYVEGVIRRAIPGATLQRLDVRPSDLLDTSQPLWIQATYSAPSVLVEEGATALLPLPLLGTRVGMVNFVIGKTGLAERRFPLVTEMACGIREQAEWTLDPRFDRVRTGTRFPAVRNDELSWAMHVAATGGVLRAENDFRLHVVEFDPAEYDALKETLRKMEVAQRRMPLFEGLSAGAPPDVVVLDDTGKIIVHDPLHWTATRDLRKRVMTYAGKKANAEIKISYNPAWEEVALEQVRVTDREGSVHSIRPEEVNVMDAPWSGAARRYPAGKTLVASLPGVDIGSTLEYRVVHTVRDRPFFALQGTFQAQDPIRRKRLSVTAPADLALQVDAAAFDGAFTNSVHRDGQTEWHTWEWSDVDLPALATEEALPPLWAVVPTVFVSAGNWADYAERLTERLDAATRDQVNATETARELVADAADRQEAVRRIRDYVAVHVRDAGPGLQDVPLSSVSAADTTLADGYGNTTDRAVLLCVMLRAAGFDPQFVLASSLPDVAPLRRRLGVTPDPRVFDDVLVRVSAAALGVSPEGSVYLNDTDQYSALGACRHEDRLGLSLPGGVLLRIVPVRPDGREEGLAVSVEPDGTAQLALTRRFFGVAYGAQRKQYAEMTPEECDRHFQELVAEISQGAEAVGELETDFQGYPGEVRFTVRVLDYALREDGHLYMQLPAWSDGLFPVRAATREAPLLVAEGRRLTWRAEVDAPPGWRVLLGPQEWRCDDVGGTRLAVDASLVPGGGSDGGGRDLVVEAVLNGEPALISPAHYAALRELDRRLSHPRMRTVLLEQVD